MPKTVNIVANSSKHIVMKTVLTLICFLGLSLIVGTPVSHAAVMNPAQGKQVEATQQEASKKEMRETKKETRRQFRQTLKDTLREVKQSAAAGDTEAILLVILALFIPPLAMYLYEGSATGRFWISLLLILGAVVLSILGFGWLASLAVLCSVIYTLYIIISESF